MKRVIGTVFTILFSFALGFSLMYALIYYYPQTFYVNKNEVLITDTGIEAGVNKVYDSVVVIENYSKESLASTGTGFVYSTDENNAYIMTNHHVIENASFLKVLYSDGSEIEAFLVGSDKYSDIAVLKVSKESIIKVAVLGSSENISVGQTVFTIGAPLGKEYKGTVTRGIISGKNRFVSVSVNSNEDYIMNVMQTDAAINPGNSGGPLCNINGEVVAVASMKVVETNIEGIGFAIPIEDAKAVADILMTGNIERPYMGIEMVNANEHLKLLNEGIIIDESVTKGVVVVNTFDNSPAKEAGLLRGDILLEIGEYDINNVAEYRYYLYKYNALDTIRVKGSRNNEEFEIFVKLGKSS